MWFTAHCQQKSQLKRKIFVIRVPKFLKTQGHNSKAHLNDKAKKIQKNAFFHSFHMKQFRFTLVTYYIRDLIIVALVFKLFYYVKVGFMLLQSLFINNPVERNRQPNGCRTAFWLPYKTSSIFTFLLWSKWPKIVNNDQFFSSFVPDWSDYISHFW